MFAHCLRPIDNGVTEQVRYSDRTAAAVPDRLRAIVGVALLHGLLFWAIVQGLAGGSVLGEAPAKAPASPAYNVVATPLQPPPKATKKQPEAAKALPARQAKATAVVAPKQARSVAPHLVMAPVASSGSAAVSGAAGAGVGTGAGGAGRGTGGGAGGNGTGAGAAAKAVKVAGDINSARDYPPDPEGKRLGSSVIVALTIQTDGRVGGCRVLRPSVDALADVATCRLATQRFRFRPATDAAGKPVQSAYGWKQSWFRPDASGL